MFFKTALDRPSIPKGPCNAPIVGRWKMESGFMQMVVADTMKNRPFIAILCMHKMRTRAISLGYGGCKSQSLSSMVKHKQQFMFQCIHSSNSISCTTTATHNCHCLLNSIDVILTVCLGEHGNMRSATYIHPYVDGDGKSLLMCTEDRQTFPPIETPAIPPPAMPATPRSPTIVVFLSLN